MARSKDKTNGHPNGRLEEAMTNLLQSQAMLVQNQSALQTQIAEADTRIAETNRQIAETDRELVELKRINSERFARIEAILMEHSRIFADHSRILEKLPDAIREKIGFRAPAQPA